MYNTNSQQLIEVACRELDYDNGDLVSIVDDQLVVDEEKIDWIKLCQRVNQHNEQEAQKIFFVKEEPIIVFSKAITPKDFYKIYNTIWCMARPRLLFLETPAELFVLDLAKRPIRDDDELSEEALVIVKSITEIRSKLSEYRREQIESGRTFEDVKFADVESRADRALIRDLKAVRSKLYTAGLYGSKIKYAHALIGKSIFIRYLEDRGILTNQYFSEIASSKKTWQELLSAKPGKVYIDDKMANLAYPKVLANKGFTYEVFKTIARDFNGDIFPTDDDEENVVTQHHLSILQDFLDGDVQSNSLFFWAYKFDIIPIELISNIYEEFYHYSTKKTQDADIIKGIDDKGTHYTPAPLVEFVLRRTLTENILSTNPIVLDPACGSGIFIVETFRRLVRYEMFSKAKESLTRNELLNILRRQIRGIELNEEAVKITAFSLYLALLHYQTPPDILLQIKKGKRLPHLIYSQQKKGDEQYYDILINANAFEIETIADAIINARFGSNCADVVVGNPPWGAPPKADEEGRRTLSTAIEWCYKNDFPLSDKERSQAFLWRSIDLMKDNGICGMLVSSGILLKQSGKSNVFKQSWLESITLKEVVNFVHVRDVFFSSAISPFLSVVFEKKKPDINAFIDYWTARRTKIIEHTKATILDKTDFKFFSYQETITEDIWKIFYFGNHRDLALISRLRLYQQLADLEYIPVKGAPRRQGFIEGNKKLDADWLLEYKELPANCFSDRYSKIPFNKVLVDVPPKVKERGAKHIFEGKRILVGKVSQKTDPKGQLIARLETRKFSFRNTINCIKLKPEYQQYYNVILGILWSSVSRYYFFLTASKWGVWHDQVYADEILKLPIAIPTSRKLLEGISQVVTSLSNGQFDQTPKSGANQPSLFEVEENVPVFGKTQHQLEATLDKYIFQLYNLSDSEIDLIKDRCEMEIDFFYNDSKSVAVSNVQHLVSESGDLSTISIRRSSQKGLEPYIYTFISYWQNEIEIGKKLTYRIIFPEASPLIAVIFDLKNANSSPVPVKDVETAWNSVLKAVNDQSLDHYSSGIYIDGIVRFYSDNCIIIIKRNERRLWTRTSAREDFDATMLQAILKQQSTNA